MMTRGHPVPTCMTLEQAWDFYKTFWWPDTIGCHCCKKDLPTSDFVRVKVPKSRKRQITYNGVDWYWISFVCESCSKNERHRKAKSDGNIRRVREIHADGWHGDTEWESVLERLGHKCLRCGSKEDITRDHIKPLVNGGTHSIDNIQPLCRSCNSWKGKRTIDFRDHTTVEDTEVFPLVGVPSNNPTGGGGQTSSQGGVQSGRVGSIDRHGKRDSDRILRQNSEDSDVCAIGASIQTAERQEEAVSVTDNV